VNLIIIESAVAIIDNLYEGRGLHSFTVELNLSNSRTHS
jgi:hypothetical protein